MCITKGISDGLEVTSLSDRSHSFLLQRTRALSWSIFSQGGGDKVQHHNVKKWGLAHSNSVTWSGCSHQWWGRWGREWPWIGVERHTGSKSWVSADYNKRLRDVINVERVQRKVSHLLQTLSEVLFCLHCVRVASRTQWNIKQNQNLMNAAMSSGLDTEQWSPPPSNPYIYPCVNAKRDLEVGTGIRQTSKILDLGSSIISMV